VQRGIKKAIRRIYGVSEGALNRDCLEEEGGS
jgi:hypothetical protein